MLTFFKEENERAREHELKLLFLQMFMSNACSHNAQHNLASRHTFSHARSSAAAFDYHNHDAIGAQEMSHVYPSSSFQQSASVPHSGELFYPNILQVQHPTSESPTNHML